MLQDPLEVEAAARGSAELLLDFGGFITGGRRPPGALVATLWMISGTGGVALWYRFEWLFDHYPGSAVLVGGFWLLLTIAAVGLAAARVKYAENTAPGDRDLPSNTR